MTGFEIYRRAMSLLGYTNSSGDIADSSVLINRTADALHHICMDLGLQAPKILSDELSLNEKQCDAVICGVAMLLSLGQGDSEMNAMFTSIYNSKRSAVKAESNKISDVLPICDGGM